MTISIVTTDDLQELRLELLRDISQLLHAHTPPPHFQPPLNSADVKRILGISHNTLQRYRNKGIIPFSKVGRDCRYEAEHVQELRRTLRSARIR